VYKNLTKESEGVSI